MKRPSKHLHLLCYSFSSWPRLGVSACAQFEIFVVKVGSTCESETDLDEKRIFHFNCRKSCQRPIEIFLFSKYHCTTLTIKLELDVSVCAQLEIFTHKNNFTWLNFTKPLYFGLNNLSQIDAKMQIFYHRKSSMKN